MRPHRQQPTRLPVPGILQARTLEWVTISFSNAWKWKVKVKSLSLVRPSAIPWTAAHKAPPSMGFSRQECWSGVTLPSPEAYLRLLIFLPAILIPACASSILAFHMMYSAYKLNKQGDNIQPWWTPFPIWNPSVVPCPVLTAASWLAYRFHKRRSGGLVFPSLEEFPTVCWDPHSQRLWHSQ